MNKTSFISKAAVSLAKRSGKSIPAADKNDLQLTVHADFSGSSYVCGFASCDITPSDILSKTYWMAGYNIGKKITGVLDNLTANAMWIGTSSGDGIILVSCDLVGITGYDIDVIRGYLRPFCAMSGCRHIVFSCTHTHAGIDTMGYWGPLPKSGKDKEYMQFLKEKIAEICLAAYNDRRKGKLYYSTAEARELVDRWREPKNFTNNALNRIRFVPDDGSKETWYINFGAHPNTMGGKNRMLSADYPCYMRREIKRNKDVNILFSVSTIGTTDIGNVAKNNTERTILGGYMLGKHVLGMDDGTELAPSVKVAVKHFVMPIDNPVLALANMLHLFTTKKCRADSSLGFGFVSEIDYIRLGELEILTMPGEMFSELVLPGGYCDKDSSATGDGDEVNPPVISDIFGDKLVIFGVTNDMAGYGIAPNDFVLDEAKPFIDRGKDRFGRSHYHETNSCGIGTARKIYNACLEISEKVR